MQTMKKIAIVNGPNLNLLGTRQIELYSAMPFDEYVEALIDRYDERVKLTYFQSNIEGELIDHLHAIGFTYDYILLNAGGYTHTSVALADAVAAIKTPVVEVHITNIFAREEYRHISLLSKHCKGIISGFGYSGYRMALEYCLE